MKHNFFQIWFLVLCFVFLCTSSALAFIEYGNFIELKSKKQLNCGFCHKHINGPDGNELGQLGSLTEEETKLTALNQYIEAGEILKDSPILSKFGNHLVKKVGYELIASALEDPIQVVNELKNSDLDTDGISDAEEILEGTLPDDPLDGNPWKLFVNSTKKQWFELLFQAITIFFLVLALSKLKKLSKVVK